MVNLPGLPPNPDVDQIVSRMTGCDWGYVLALTDDREPCPQRATHRMVLHGQHVAYQVQLCDTHHQTVLTHTDTHTPTRGTEGIMCCSTEHGHVKHELGAATYPADRSDYCRCLGVDKGILAEGLDPATQGACCGAVSGDDGLCDRCRTTCNQVPATGADPGPVETPAESADVVDANLRAMGSAGLNDPADLPRREPGAQFNPADMFDEEDLAHLGRVLEGGLRAKLAELGAGFAGPGFTPAGDVQSEPLFGWTVTYTDGETEVFHAHEHQVTDEGDLVFTTRIAGGPELDTASIARGGWRKVSIHHRPELVEAPGPLFGVQDVAIDPGEPVGVAVPASRGGVL